MCLALRGHSQLAGGTACLSLWMCSVPAQRGGSEPLSNAEQVHRRMSWGQREAPHSYGGHLAVASHDVPSVVKGVGMLGWEGPFYHRDAAKLDWTQPQLAPHPFGTGKAQPKLHLQMSLGLVKGAGKMGQNHLTGGGRIECTLLAPPCALSALQSLLPSTHLSCMDPLHLEEHSPHTFVQLSPSQYSGLGSNVLPQSGFPLPPKSELPPPCASCYITLLPALGHLSVPIINHWPCGSLCPLPVFPMAWSCLSVHWPQTELG